MIDNTLHFPKKELQCKCGCKSAPMNREFMERIELLRVEYGKPIYATSAYRCPNHDVAEGGARVHPSGRAIDLQCYGGQARELIKIATKMNFLGLGISQTGPYDKRFIHLDDLQSTLHKRPWVWTY